MFGDDLNATVMIERVGFGTAFGRAREGFLERLGGLTRGKRKHGWSRNGQRRQRGSMSLEKREKRVVRLI